MDFSFFWRMWNKQSCPVCGKPLRTGVRKAAICTELARDWNLTSEEWQAFNIREGEYCKACNASLRTRIFTDALVKTVNQTVHTPRSSLKSLLKDEKFLALKIAEINGCGNINQFLLASPNVFYSEYGSKDPNIKHEDLTCLTYSSDFFDLVINTEVLEHIPSYKLALAETCRVLKPGGHYVFTVPIIFSRKSRQRAEILDRGLNCLLAKSYHGAYSERNDDRLVFWEFGGDFIEDLRLIFDGVETYMPDPAAHPSLCAFICMKGTRQATGATAAR